MKQYTSVCNHDAGIIRDYIEEKSKEYVDFANETLKNGYQMPTGAGVLIFDEVKVMAKVMFNAQSEKIMGLALTVDEMKGLHDIFVKLAAKDPMPAEYILHFLWRDLTSNFDLIGPYFTLTNTIKVGTRS